MTVYIRQMSSVCIKNIVFEFASCTQKKKKNAGIYKYAMWQPI